MPRPKKEHVIKTVTELWKWKNISKNHFEMTHPITIWGKEPVVPLARDYCCVFEDSSPFGKALSGTWGYCHTARPWNLAITYCVTLDNLFFLLCLSFLMLLVATSYGGYDKWKNNRNKAVLKKMPAPIWIPYFTVLI